MQVLGVFGGSSASSEEEFVAARVGATAARCGWVVLTGGGAGVMSAACRGAVEAGGLTVAILPTAYAGSGYPNPWVHIPIFTGAGHARNSFNVLSSTLCVAIAGGTGTLSEIALALKNSIPVWCWRSWLLESPAEGPPRDLRRFDSSEDLIEALGDLMA